MTMNCSENLSILAFTDSPRSYRNFQLHSNIKIEFCTDLENYLREALNFNFSGMILEMRKVMGIPSRDRNKLLMLAANQPLMRTRTHKGTVIYVDDPDSFRCNCVQRTKGLVRQHERVAVNLQAMVSHEDDHVMVNKFSAEITNISETGCFLTTSADLPENNFINLRINSLSNRLPICCGISWKTDCTDNRQGYGIQFIQIHQDQTKQIYNEFIKPKLRKNLKLKD
jgi:hypothetical protein